MEVLGSHLLLELKDCNSELLNDLSYIRKAMIETAQEVGATIVGESFHHFSPQGVTEYSYAAADIFSCGTSFRPREAASKLAESLECRNPEIKEIARGLAIQEAVGL